MRRLVAILAAAVGGLLALAPGASAQPTPFATPLFGLTTGPTGGLLVADSGQGIVRGHGDSARLIAELPGVTDMDVRTRHSLWALTSGGPENSKLWIVAGGTARPVADLWAFEVRHNPHPALVESNPFDVESLGPDRAVVADAAGNDLLRVDADGTIRLVAVLPNQDVSTANAKRIVGCPEPDDPQNAEICDLPARIPAEPVATSVAIGPDGAYYAGELKGFPAPLHRSRVWRIEPDARNARCGTSPECRVVVRGLTSVLDLHFWNDRLHVAQIDDKSWFAVELGDGVGGSVHSCDVATGSCDTVVSGVPILTAITVRHNTLWGTVNALIPGQADVVRLQDAFGMHMQSSAVRTPFAASGG
jgi:hypothetical protein